MLTGLIFQAIVLSWILKLEKSGCECSDDWRRDYIKYYTIAVIALTLALLTSARNFSVYIRNFIFIVPFYLVYLYSVLTFVPNLWSHECDCATKGDWRDDFIFWWIAVGLLLQGVGAALLMTKRR